MVLGPAGHRVLASPDGTGDPPSDDLHVDDFPGDDVPVGDVLVGEDPLAVYGSGAAARVRAVDGYTNVADLMVNARYDPDNDEIPAFEEQVGSHGGLGGDQERPFVLGPLELTPPARPLYGPVAVHHLLKGWLAELGQPVTARRTEAVS